MSDAQGPWYEVRNDVVGRFKSLDHLEAAWLLHEHTLPLMVSVAHLHHETTRHPPDEVALGERDRDKLDTPRIRAFAEKIDPESLFDTVDPPFVDVTAQGFGQHGLALALPILICSHNSAPCG